MMEMITGDLRTILDAVLFNGDWVSWAMMGGAAVIGALMMRGFGQLAGIGILCLVLFAAANYVYGALTMGDSATGAGASPWTTELHNGWNSVIHMQSGVLVGYLVVFMIAAAVLFVLKSMVFRAE